MENNHPATCICINCDAKESENPIYQETESKRSPIVAKINSNLSPEELNNKLNAQHYELHKSIINLGDDLIIANDVQDGLTEDIAINLSNELDSALGKMLMKLEQSEKLLPEHREQAQLEIEEDMRTLKPQFKRSAKKAKNDSSSIFLWGAIGTILFIVLIVAIFFGAFDSLI